MNDKGVLVIVGFSFGCQSFRLSFEISDQMRKIDMLHRAYRARRQAADAFHISMRPYGCEMPWVFDKVSLRRRRDAPRPKETRTDVEARALPSQEQTSEHLGPQAASIIDEETISESENLLLKANLRPLPKCPECNTAVGSSQRDCHRCGRSLKKVH